MRFAPWKFSAWDELAAAYRTSGVVIGEFGLSDAYARKRDELASKKSDDNARVRAFSAWLTEILDADIRHENRRAE